MSGIVFDLDQPAPTNIKWIKYQSVEPGWQKVAGIQFRRDEAAAFLRAAKRAKASGKPFGTLLQREPDNPNDANAILITGVAPKKKFFGWGPSVERHLGYVEKDDAARIAELFSSEMPITARVVRGYISRNGFVDISIEILIPSKALRKESGW